MHFRLAFITIVLSMLLLPSLAFAKNDNSYPAFDRFRQYSEPAIFNKVSSNLSGREMPTLSFKNRQLCGKERDSFVSQLESSTDMIYNRANDIAKKIQACPQSCEATINKAEYCAYHRHRNIEFDLLHYWSSGFFEAEFLFEKAVQQQRLPEEQLSVGADMIIIESLDLFQIALKALKGDISPSFSDQNPRWSLSSNELRQMGEMIEFLGSVEMIQGKTKGLVHALIASHEMLGKLNTDLYQELSRARLSPVKVVGMWETRILQSAAQLVWAQQIFTNSARKAKNRTALQINTEANHNPQQVDGSRWQQTATCFKRLSLNSDAAIGGIQMELEILQSCRSFKTCGDTKQPLEFPDINRYSAHIEKSLKEIFAITRSMCLAK